MWVFHSMLSIFFDYQIFALQKFGGISRYFVDLATGLHKLGSVNAKIVSAYHFNHYLSCAPSDIRTPSLYLPYSTHRLINRCLNPAHRTYTSAMCSRINPHLVHRTYYAHTGDTSSTLPSVITVYDMINEKFPHYFPNNHITVHRKKEAIFSADHIICISKTTLNDLLMIYPSVRHKASCVYLDVPKPKASNSTENFRHPRPYILYVGHRNGYKNFDVLLRSFLSTKELYTHYDLVAFGGPPLSKSESSQILASGVNTNRVFHLNGPDTLLYALLRSAQCLVYPSLYEGFGIPPIEAMHLGCPVVASHSSCLPEILSEAALFFDPLSVSDMTKALQLVLNNTHTRKRLVDSGFLQASQYDNGNMIKLTSRIYNSVI